MQNLQEALSDEKVKRLYENSNIKNEKDYSAITPRENQIYIKDALELKQIDLFTDSNEQGYKLLSRADVILIFTLYKGGLDEFLEDYKNNVREMVSKHNYKVIEKPHYYLKRKIG